MQSYITEHYQNERMCVPEKLKRSREAAEGIPVRAIKCPNCGFYLLDAYGYGHYLVRIKCRKCKFDEVIDTALFRTMRPGRQQRHWGSCPAFKKKAVPGRQRPAWRSR